MPSPSVLASEEITFDYNKWIADAARRYFIARRNHAFERNDQSLIRENRALNYLIEMIDAEKNNCDPATIRY